MLRYLLDTNIVIYVLKRRPVEVLASFNARYGPGHSDWDGVGENYRRYNELLEKTSLFRRPEIRAKPFYQRALALPI